MGGLSKRAYQINTISRQERSQALQLDAGGLLFKHEHLSPGRQHIEQLTAKAIVDIYNIMGVDGVGIGQQELAAGLAFLKEQQRRAKFPWLSANLVSQSTRQPLFTPYTVKTVNKVRIGITGLTRSTARTPFRPNDDATILPWQEVLPWVVKELRSKSDMIILLSSLTPEEGFSIARSFPDIHLILQANASPTNVAPMYQNNTLLCQTGHQGKYLGVLEVNWEKSASWGMAAEQLQNKRRELAQVDRQLSRYPNNETLARKRQRLADEVKGLEDYQANQQGSRGTASQYTNRFVPLDATLPDQPEVQQAIEQLKKAINEADRNVTASRPPAGLTPAKGKEPSAAQPPSHLDSYAGWTACIGCHRTQAKAWQLSRHAQSFATLVSKSSQYNNDCVGCHVTGIIDQQPAPSVLTLPHALRQVGCEACHGPGNRHRKEPARQRLVKKPGPQVCRQCHTPPHDTNFDYRQRLSRLNCG